MPTLKVYCFPLIQVFCLKVSMVIGLGTVVIISLVQTLGLSKALVPRID